MFKKIKNIAMKGGYRLALSKGADCPECGKKLHLPARMPEGGMDAVISCHHCGWSDSFSGLFSLSRGDHLGAKQSKPEETKILESVDGDRYTWLMPAKRRPNFMLFFSALWLLFIGFFTGVMVFGNPTDSSTGEPLGWWVYLFLVPFWAVGLGLAYVGLRQAFTELILRVDGREVTLLRKFFGRVWGKSIARDDVGTVSLKEAYRQNESPVYHVFVDNKNGKDIKFGSGLNHDEKRWMLGQLKVVLGQAVATVAADGTVSSLAGMELDEYQGKGLEIKRVGRDGFRVKRRYGCGKWLITAGLFALVVAGVIFMKTVGEFSDDSGGEGVRWFLFNLFDYAGLIAVLVIVMVAAGVIAGGVWALGRVVVSEFGPDALTVTTRWRHNRKRQRYERSLFRKVRRSNSGHVNNDPRYRVVLIGTKKSVTVCGFENEEVSLLLKAWLEHWMREGIPANDVMHGR